MIGKSVHSNNFKKQVQTQQISPRNKMLDSKSQSPNLTKALKILSVTSLKSGGTEGKKKPHQVVLTAGQLGINMKNCVINMPQNYEIQNFQPEVAMTKTRQSVVSPDRSEKGLNRNHSSPVLSAVKIVDLEDSPNKKVTPQTLQVPSDEMCDIEDSDEEGKVNEKMSHLNT